MQCKCPQNIALAAAIFAALAAGLAAADDTRQTSAGLPPAGEIRVVGSDEVEVTDKDDKDVVESPAKPKTAVPTPAKRKSDSGPPPVEAAAKAEPAGQSARKAEPAIEQPKGVVANESLQPVPDSLDTGSVTVEAASFKGITPGATTKEDVEKAWGKPKNSSRQDDTLVQLYSVEPFKMVEVNYAGSKVSSIVIRFEQAFPADVVARQLELAAIRPVPVSNELGEILGQSYPERGVLFAFEPSDESGKVSTKVQQIVLEPITAEPFVLRAETTLDVRSDLSLRDLEQALTLEPENARAHWLRSRALAAAEQHEKAATAAAEAVRLEPGNAQFRVTLAQALAQTGRLTEALDHAQKAVEAAAKRPHVKARALCIVGDLLASGPKPDYKKAVSFHTQAIQTADPLSTDPHPAIRLAAKEVLIDAHFGAAHDIAWGEWKDKDKAVARWLERAVAVADDMVKNEGGSRDLLFRVHSRALAAYVGVRGGIDPEPSAKALIATGDELIAAAGDPLRKAQLQSDLGTASTTPYRFARFVPTATTLKNMARRPSNTSPRPARPSRRRPRPSCWGGCISAWAPFTRSRIATTAPPSVGSTRPFRCWIVRHPRTWSPIWAATARPSSAWACRTGRSASGRRRSN